MSTEFDNNTAVQLAMEATLAKMDEETEDFGKFWAAYMNLQGFVGMERAIELLAQAREILKMTIPA